MDNGPGWCHMLEGTAIEAQHIAGAGLFKMVSQKIGEPLKGCHWSPGLQSREGCPLADGEEATGPQVWNNGAQCIVMPNGWGWGLEGPLQMSLRGLVQAV